MSDTTYEEVRRCPRCNEPGEEKKGGRLPHAERGSSSINFTCRNSRCRWCNTNWIVQVRADGTFPPALKNRPKSFPALSLGNDMRNAMEALEELQTMTTQTGAEIRR